MYELSVKSLIAHLRLHPSAMSCPASLLVDASARAVVILPSDSKDERFEPSNSDLQMRSWTTGLEISRRHTLVRRNENCDEQFDCRLCKKEASEFTASSSELKTHIGAITKAIDALKQDMGGAFLQTQAATTRKNFVDNDLHMLGGDCSQWLLHGHRTLLWSRQPVFDGHHQSARSRYPFPHRWQ